MVIAFIRALHHLPYSIQQHNPVTSRQGWNRFLCSYARIDGHPPILRLASYLGSYCNVAQPTILLPSNAPTISFHVLVYAWIPCSLTGHPLSQDSESGRVLGIGFPYPAEHHAHALSFDSFISDMRVTALVNATVSRPRRWY